MRFHPSLKPTPLTGFAPAWAGQFDTIQDWATFATSAMSGVVGSVGEHLPPVCIDAKGRRCHVGKDFMRAHNEGAFPIRYFWDFVAIPATETKNDELTPRQRERALREAAAPDWNDATRPGGGEDQD